MFRVFQEEKLITIAMFTCLGISIILRIFLGLLYRNMIKEADNMAITKNRLLRQCKTKFASCYEMSGGVANISVFVDKFLGRMALGHLSFDTLYHLSGQMMLLSVVCSGIGVCKSILTGRTLGDVLPFYIASFFGLYAYFSISTVVDVSGKKRVLKVNLVDYLENHLSPRIDVTRQDIEMLYGESVFEEKQGSRTPARGRRRKNILTVDGHHLQRRQIHAPCPVRLLYSLRHPVRLMHDLLSERSRQLETVHHRHDVYAGIIDMSENLCHSAFRLMLFVPVRDQLHHYLMPGHRAPGTLLRHEDIGPQPAVIRYHEAEILTLLPGAHHLFEPPFQHLNDTCFLTLPLSAGQQHDLYPVLMKSAAPFVLRNIQIVVPAFHLHEAKPSGSTGIDPHQPVIVRLSVPALRTYLQPALCHKGL